MSDVYVQKNETNNAEVILQSVIDNADKQEYTDLAKQKLQEIKDKQQAAKEVEKQQEQMKVEFDNKGSDIKLDMPPKVEKKDSTQTNNTQPK